MQRRLILLSLASSSVFAQPEANHFFVRTGVIGGAVPGTNPVQGAPYSASIKNESVQTLADGNRIVQSSTGTTARDSMGRTRQDTPLPMIGTMAPADAPHLVFLQDPVAQVSYTLNLTDKTAMKGPAFSSTISFAGSASSVAAGSTMMARRIVGPTPAALPPPQLSVMIQRTGPDEEGEAQTEDLGSKIMEGVSVIGTRATRTIPAGQVGNDRPLSIMTEVWTSPDLKTIVYSKRSDPRIGDQTFQLTNIVRAEPDPTLFTVPSDFRILDSPGPIVYKDAGAAAQAP